MKIAVLGYSGAGKSTLAKRLSVLYGVPVLFLDVVHWLPGWNERPDAEGREIVGRFMDENRGGWVVEGNYQKYAFERRLCEADEILLLLLPLRVCLPSAYRRYRDYIGKARESMTEGCYEKFDAEFLFWILFGGRTRKRRGEYRKIAERYPEKTTIFRSREAVERYWEEKVSEIGQNKC